MAKGSQLSQLKSALSQAGITGQQKAGKKRKRTNSQEKDKDKRTAKLDEIQKKLNPFDTKVTKLKHEVGGRKLKGVTGKPSQSKQAGIEQRKKTLLVEYEEKGRAGGIVDRRFGENDPSMSLEERMLERFTRERQRSSRATAFNLEDEDELTHYGQSLSKFDDFDNSGLRLEDEDEADDAGQAQEKHFKGFSDDEDDDENDQPERKKSKAEAMAEVMAKSKEHKFRRQMERQEEDNVRHELDQQFDSLRDLIYAPDPLASGSNSDQLGSAPKPIEIEANELDYDQRVRELAFDARAKPKDRTKTEEEVALAEKEALEKAERQRRKRMLGLDDESGSEDEGGRPKKKRRRGGDDLEDDFDDGEGWDGIGTGLGRGDDDAGEVGGLAGSGDDSGEEEDDDEDEDEDGDGQMSDGLDDDEESEVEGDHENLVKTTKPPKSKSKARSKELPFTFPCPASHEELLEILDGVDDKDVPTVIQRIRALYHTSLAPDNKVKLQTLASVIIDHLLYISTPPDPHFTLVSSLLPHLSALTLAYPIQIAEHTVAKLSLMHKNLRRGLSRGPLDPASKTWPGLPECTLLRIIGATWPTSDLHHAVISPTRVLMGAYLGLARVRSLADVASGLFLCTLFLQFEQLSKRLVPEAVNFAVNSVVHLAPTGYASVDKLPGAFPAPDFRSELCRPLALDVKKAKGKTVVAKADLASLMVNSEVPKEEGKLQLLILAVDLLGRFADMYKGIDGFVELYAPVLEILLHVKEKCGSVAVLQTRLASTTDALKRLLKFAHEARQPLLLQAHKPIPIPTYIPKFDTSKSSYLRHQDPDHERNAAAKLRREYKEERKGAIRELRKDARFLAGVEQKKQAEKDRSYNESLKKVYGTIQSERAEEKAMEREKTKDRKRSGRK